VPDESSAAAEKEHELRLSLPQRIQIAVISWIAAVVVRVIGSTLRMTITYEEGSICGLDHIRPGIFPFWHRCVLPATWLFRNRGIGVLTSLSRDGEYIARVIRRFGFIPVRGSSSRGGKRGLLKMQTLVNAGETVAFTIDGPRGPRYQAKKGPVLLARMSGVPVTPFYVAVERGWELKTWDAMVIPKPFSRTYVRVARHIFVPPDADDATLDRCHAEMQAALERITTFAESRFAAQDSVLP
jgi:lysophospholipid acyltransferase (LPLAT)-like uncharacterized protein